MNGQNCITGSILIRDQEIFLDGESVFHSKNSSPADFFQLAYETLKIEYPKFFRMDHLSKTGFIATEILLRNMAWKKKYSAEDIGIIFSTSNASLDTDLRYLETTKTMASPSLFVYTLPSIVVGEICIRHGIKGENACFIFDIFDEGFLANYVNRLLDLDVEKAILAGWADFYNDKFEAFFYLVESGDSGTRKHNEETVRKIYNGYERIN